MKIFKASLFGIVLIASCSKNSDDDKHQEVPPSSQSDQIPRWEVVDRKDVSFNYYITNKQTGFQLGDGTGTANTVEPWLTLTGAEGEPMSFIMMFEVASPEGCEKHRNDKIRSWKPIVFSYPEGQFAMYDENYWRTSAGKQASLLHILVTNEKLSKCVKLTFNDIDFKGYDHALALTDNSEMSKAIGAIAGSVRLK